MKIRLIILLMPLVIALTIPLWWTPVADFLRPRSGPAQTQVSPGQFQQFAMEGVSLTRSIAGRPDWQITASRLTTTERENELLLEDVDAVLRGEGGGRFQVTSEKGLYDTDRLVLTLEQRVRIQLENDHELKTDLLHYLEKTGRVETEAPVRLQGPGLMVRGQGMTYDLDSGSYAVGGRVRVVIR